MANQLKMAVVQAILTLQGLGWSQQRIAQELGIDHYLITPNSGLWTPASLLSHMPSRSESIFRRISPPQGGPIRA